MGPGVHGCLPSLPQQIAPCLLFLRLPAPPRQGGLTRLRPCCTHTACVRELRKFSLEIKFPSRLLTFDIAFLPVISQQLGEHGRVRIIVSMLRGPGRAQHPRFHEQQQARAGTQVCILGTCIMV